MLHERLKKLRNELKLTQTQLAEKLDITRGTYAHYEIGKRQPDYETLQKIADFFEVSVDYLLGRTDTPIHIEQESPDENLFFFDEENVTEEELEKLKEHLKYIRWLADQENGKEEKK
ncbi:helix-turn-helix domain-containing protein [Bacillus sp. FJAT-45037]|uniref:helix-turn-helix domain-containing protein n=1 Tax=Bacillus sp. FJAT-45037 TaxID=2011007 RepID=UPI000C23851E|nr:helix-turn-helix transcriptional regulator [Bacillus sp. FJAT-45037]